MIPIVADEVLNKNPQFKQLYNDLITNKLNPDASVKSDSKAKQAKAVDEKLGAFRENVARQKLLENHLKRLSSQEGVLPMELAEIVDVAISQLPMYDQDMSSVSKELRQEDMKGFVKSVSEVSRAISKSIERDAAVIANVAVPADISIPQKISSLLNVVLMLQRDVEQKQNQLNQLRKSLLSLLADILSTYEGVIERLVKVIEQTKYGIITRASRAQAKHLSLVAEGFEGKLRMLHYETLDQIYSPEMLNALENYRQHLNDTKVRLLQRQKSTEAELHKYNTAGKDMKGIVDNYTHIAKEIDMVVADIQRLGGTVDLEE